MVGVPIRITAVICDIFNNQIGNHNNCIHNSPNPRARILGKRREKKERKEKRGKLGITRNRRRTEREREGKRRKEKGRKGKKGKEREGQTSRNFPEVKRLTFRYSICMKVSCVCVCVNVCLCVLR